MSATILTSAKFRGPTPRRIERQLPPGAGFVLALAASALVWLPLLLWWWFA
jgi:hypothetical protein